MQILHCNAWYWTRWYLHLSILVTQSLSARLPGKLQTPNRPLTHPDRLILSFWFIFQAPFLTLSLSVNPFLPSPPSSPCSHHHQTLSPHLLTSSPCASSSFCSGFALLCALLIPDYSLVSPDPTPQPCTQALAWQVGAKKWNIKHLYMEHIYVDIEWYTPRLGPSDWNDQDLLSAWSSLDSFGLLSIQSAWLAWRTNQ